MLGVFGQSLTHLLHQQPITPVRAHSEQQGALQHALQGRFIAAHRQAQIARIKLQAVLRRLKHRGPVKQHTVAFGMRGRVKAQRGLPQAHARVGQPRGHAQGIAQHRDHTELLQRAQVAALVQRQLRHAIAGAEL